MHGIAVERQRLKIGTRQYARKCAFRGNRPGSNGVHTDSPITPFDGEAARKCFNASFGNCGGNNIGGADGCVCSGNTKDGAGALGFEPAASTGHGAVQSSHEHDVDDGLPGARGKLFGARNEISGGIVNENIEWGLLPYGIDHRFDGIGIAHVTWKSVNGAFCRCGEFGGSSLENVFAAPADVDGCSKFEETLRHGFAKAGAAAGDEDSFVLEKIGAKHARLPRVREFRNLVIG